MIGHNINSSYANRGKRLETLIDYQNHLYLMKKLAIVHKIPVEHKTYHGQSWFNQPSIVDYVGLTSGKAIAFDAKMTSAKNLPLANIPDHQVEFLTDWQTQGGQSFLVVEFTAVNEIYRLPLYVLQEAIEEATKGGRKSIPLTIFRAQAKRIEAKSVFPLDYLNLA